MFQATEISELTEKDTAVFSNTPVLFHKLVCQQ